MARHLGLGFAKERNYDHPTRNHCHNRICLVHNTIL